MAIRTYVSAQKQVLTRQAHSMYDLGPQDVKDTLLSDMVANRGNRQMKLW